jgi:hypothetical protein
VQNTSPNRAYLASVLRTFAQIQPDGWISDTLGTLGEIIRIEQLVGGGEKDRE